METSARSLAALRALCDTYVPAVQPPAGADSDAPEFWACRASDLDVDRAVADFIATRIPDEDRDQLHLLLGLLGAAQFHRLPLTLRTAVLQLAHRIPGDVARGFSGLRGLTLLHFYGHLDEQGRNPAWSASAYPGPPQVSPPARERLPLLDPESGTGHLELEADVVVVGSGAGGAVVAAEAAAAGRSVVVLEAGGYVDIDDFPTSELEGFRRMFWRGVPTPTADGTVTVLAGATLGGGTTVNWSVAPRPPDHVRADWAKEHGLADLDGAAFDVHLDAVSKRLSVTDACSDVSTYNRRLKDGAEALGWSWRRGERNADPALYDPVSAGHITLGDRSGSKQDTLATYLRDAAAAGAQILAHTRAERVLSARGRAAGVAATYRPEGRPPVRVTVRARHVAVACGALETPALLLRSAIGGPAAGRHLRLHPTVNLVGYYPERDDFWVGPPLTVLVDEFADRGDGYGFVVETPHTYTALGGAVLPWWSGREHKLLTGRTDHLAAFLALPRERGSGTVTIDAEGEGVVTYPFDDPGDVEQAWRALAVEARLHEAAGAQAIVDITPRRNVWRRGQDLEGFLRRAEQTPFRSVGGRFLGSAHQMGSARMGPSPGSSVADPEGQLHDVPGVWIADTSAFPTALGINPMVTCMALARRTAHALLAAD